ncbi:MAG: hypothetical protein GY833_23940 [Aestuariibacter sp.]|nr:hypothetical protein [Aestuariibacter sp.]
MAVTKIVDPSAESPAVSTDDGNTMYLTSREPAMSDNQTQTAEVWSGTRAAALEMYEEYKENSLIKNMRIVQNGGKSDLNVLWSVDFTEGETPEPDADNVITWDWDFIEIPTPLAAHEYFQAAYIPASGELIEDEIARADSAIKRGRSFAASGAYADWVNRYYALRMAGVEEWMQYGIEISKSYSTDDIDVAKEAHQGVGEAGLMATVSAPADVVTAISELQRIESYGTSSPTSAVFAPSKFEFVKRPPKSTYSLINNTNPRFDIVETWLGVAKWSAVIYPGGSWDPPQND